MIAPQVNRLATTMIAPSKIWFDELISKRRTKPLWRLMYKKNNIMQPKRLTMAVWHIWMEFMTATDLFKMF